MNQCMSRTTGLTTPTPTAALQHTLQRHNEILQDYTQEYSRTKVGGINYKLASFGVCFAKYTSNSYYRWCIWFVWTAIWGCLVPTQIYSQLIVNTNQMHHTHTRVLLVDHKCVHACAILIPHVSIAPQSVRHCICSAVGSLVICHTFFCFVFRITY